jgi:hypothetical protein
MAINMVLPTIDDLSKSKNYQNLASIDTLNKDNVRTPEWQEKKFLSDLMGLYKSVQYQVFDIIDNDDKATLQFRSGVELYDYISQTINKGKPYCCSVYYNYDKKHIVLLNNKKIIYFIPNVNESKKIKSLETLIENKIRKILKEDDKRTNILRIKSLIRHSYIYETLIEKESLCTGLLNRIGEDKYLKLDKIIKDIDERVDTGKIKISDEKIQSLDVYFPLINFQIFMKWLKAYSKLTRDSSFISFVNSLE